MTPRNDKPDDDALAEWIRHVGKTLPRDEFDVPTERAHDFTLLYGVCVQASRYALAYLSLRDAGFERESHASARAAFEHAVTAHWVYFSEGGIKRFGIQINRDFRSYFLSMSSYLSNDELRATAAQHPEVAGKGMPSFTEVMWDLDSGSFLKTSYRTLSLSVHPTHATVGGYLEEVDGRTHLRHEARPGSEYPVLYTTAISAMLALSLVEFIVNPFEARAMLDDASERLRLPILLNDSLPDEKRREF